MAVWTWSFFGFSRHQGGLRNPALWEHVDKAGVSYLLASYGVDNNEREFLWPSQAFPSFCAQFLSQRDPASERIASVLSVLYTEVCERFRFTRTTTKAFPAKTQSAWHVCSQVRLLSPHGILNDDRTPVTNLICSWFQTPSHKPHGQRSDRSLFLPMHSWSPVATNHL